MWVRWLKRWRVCRVAQRQRSTPHGLAMSRWCPLCPPTPPRSRSQFNTEIQVFRGFWMVSWFLAQFGAEERQRADREQVAPETLLDELLAQTEPGAGGINTAAVLESGTRRNGARGSRQYYWLSGFSHPRPYLSGALIEGLAFALRSGRERTERRTKTPDHVYSAVWGRCAE